MSRFGWASRLTRPVTRVGPDRIRKLYSGLRIQRKFANTHCGLERGKPYTYVGAMLEGVFAGV
jgi:hypothetical protein